MYCPPWFIQAHILRHYWSWNVVVLLKVSWAVHPAPAPRLIYAPSFRTKSILSLKTPLLVGAIGSVLFWILKSLARGGCRDNPPKNLKFKVILKILNGDWGGEIDCVSVNSGTDRNMQFIKSRSGCTYGHMVSKIFICKYYLGSSEA